MRHRLIIATFTLLLALGFAGSTRAQVAPADLEDYVNAKRSSNNQLADSAVDRLFSDTAILRYVKERSLQAPREAQNQTRLASGIQSVQALLTQKQIGAVGATSVAAKPTSPSFFSAAIESGVLTRTTEDTVTTFRINALAAYRLLTGTAGADCSALWLWCKTDDANPLRSLSGVVSFDSSRADRVLPTGTAAGPEAILLKGERTISNWGVRYELYNRQDPRGKAFQDAWLAAAEKLRSAAADLATAAEPLVNDLISLPGYQALKDASRQQFTNAPLDFDQLAVLRTNLLESFYAAWVARGNPALIAPFNTALLEFRRQQAKIVQDVLFRRSLTVEYNYQLPVDQPTLSNVRLTFQSPIGGRPKEPSSPTVPATITFNLAADFYNARPGATHAGKWRDAQAALELNRNLPESRVFGKPVFSLAGYYQYMRENALIQFDSQARTPFVDIPLPKAAKELLQTKGNIGLVQAKLTFPIGTSGVSMPLAISWSNRTELIRANEVRGQFGFTFDLDKLLAKVVDK